MNTFLKRCLGILTCAAVLQGTVLSSGMAASESEPDKVVNYTTKAGITLQYTEIECTPNTEKEAMFSPVGGNKSQWGNEYSYFMDGNASRTYTFSGEIGQMAYVVMDLSQEFLVSVSTDKKAWTEVLDSRVDGRFREMRAVDLSPWFEESRKVYVKISDSIPSTGWGGQIRALRYVTLTGGDDLRAYEDISQEWKTSTGSTVNAGQSVSVSSGDAVTLEKTLSIPEEWIGGQLGLSFSWVESATTPIVRVDGQEVASMSTYGNNLTIPLPEGSNGKQVKVEVATTATEDGKCGLWNSVRFGYLDSITMPESTWSLDGETRKIHGNYFTDESTDLVQLNALAGNYASTLVNGEYGLLNFNNLVRKTISNSQLYYAHDTSRTLVALAFEEMYSPIVRLDTIEHLYQGIKGAMVPGSDFDIFLKYDARPRNAQAATLDGIQVLRMQSHQDASGNFVDVYAALSGEDAAGQTVEDEPKEDGLKRVYTAGDQSITVDATWPGGTSDKPTTLAFSSNAEKEYSVVFANFQKPLGNGTDLAANFTTITTETNEYVGMAGLGDMEIAPPQEGYLVLSSQESWTASPTIITWDVAPEKILLKTNEDNSAFTQLEFVYAADAKPTLTTLCFNGADIGLKWAYRCASNVVSEGVYGANGYDPTYVCGGEGLGPGALAAAAYIFKKYDHPLAEEAEALALKASRSAYRASLEIHHTPSIHLDRVQAAYFLCRMGYEDEFVLVADYYGQYVLREQQEDGTFYWFDARAPLTLQVAYEATGYPDYLDAYQRYLSTITFEDEYMVYKETKYTGSFSGAGELSHLGYIGNTELIAKVMQYSQENMDDTGVFACSDLNPYFLGWSLQGVMKVQYDLEDKKTVIGKGQYALYDADGNVEILDYPTAYVNNPNQYSDFILSSRVALGDINADGSVNASDALLALQHSVKLTTLEGDKFTAADVNVDDKVDAADALLILQKSVGLVDEF